MPTLAKFQQQFMAALLNEETLPEIVNPTHLNVYRNNVRFILTDVLAGVYPVTKKLVGEKFFAAMVLAFIKTTLPRHGDMHLYGAELADFIAGFAPATTLPYLPDVARLEWAWHRAYYAPAHQPLTADDAAKLATGELAQAQLAPCAFLVVSHYPILDIWQANRSDSEQEIDLQKGGISLLVYRGHEGVEVSPLTTEETAFFHAIEQGQLFADAATALPVETSHHFFRRLLQSGVLTAMR